MPTPAFDVTPPPPRAAPAAAAAQDDLRGLLLGHAAAERHAARRRLRTGSPTAAAEHRHRADAQHAAQPAQDRLRYRQAPRRRPQRTPSGR